VGGKVEWKDTDLSYKWVSHVILLI
jgi:hypothetical protein